MNTRLPATVPRITLEQWRTLVAVVDAGGYAQAAEQLSKSQSTITYAVQKLEGLLGVEVLAVHGRKAELTPVGRMLYERARVLLDEAGSLERAAHRSSAGWESEIWIAAEVLFPTWLLLECLGRFGEEAPQTHVEVLETVIEGTTEALVSGQADLGLSPRIPPNFNGEPLMPIHFLPVAHPSHTLHQLGREVSMKDLRRHRHIVVRDTSSQRKPRAETMDIAQRWTVTNMATSIGAVCRGFGFSWFPVEKIRTELAEGILKPLPLKGGNERTMELYLIFPDQDAAGPGVLRLAEIIRESTASACKFD